jgi:hypothetical protein
MALNHGLLNAMGVGHPALTKVAEASFRHGGMACKLTGAGGGGCAITLVPEGSIDLEALRDELWYVEHNNHVILFTCNYVCDCSGMGFDTYISKAGGQGVKWHVQYPEIKDDSTMRKGCKTETSAAKSLQESLSTSSSR